MDLDLVEYKGVQIQKNEAEVLYTIEEQTDREFSINRHNYSFSRHASMEVRISNNKVWKLCCYNCNLNNLPNSFGGLTSLQELWLGRNYISDLPKSFINLKVLRQLDLSRNKLYFIPESIFKLPNLIDLNLAFNINRLILDEDIKFVKLQNLDLRGNNIRSLPEQMRKLIYLKNLSLQFTGLTHLPKSLISLYRLQNIYLHEGYLDQESVEVVNKLKNKGVKIYNEPYLHMTLEYLPISNETLEKLELLDYISDNDQFLNSEELDIFNKIAARINKDAMNDKIEHFPSLSGDSMDGENDYLLQGEFETVSNKEIFEILTQLKYKIYERKV